MQVFKNKWNICHFCSCNPACSRLIPVIKSWNTCLINAFKLIYILFKCMIILEGWIKKAYFPLMINVNSEHIQSHLSTDEFWHLIKSVLPDFFFPKAYLYKHSLMYKIWQFCIALKMKKVFYSADEKYFIFKRKHGYVIYVICTEQFCSSMFQYLEEKG